MQFLLDRLLRRKSLSNGSIHRDPAQWVTRLAAMGWYKHLDARAVDPAKAAVVAERYVLAGDVGRVFHADAEELAEGGVRDFIAMAAPFLRHVGIDITATFRPWKRAPGISDDEAAWMMPVESLRVRPAANDDFVYVVDDVRYGYVVRVGPRSFTVVESGEADGWTRATVATLDILNTLLQAHGSAERAWAYMCGNDLTVVFATAEARAFIDSTLGPRGHLHGGYGR